MNEKYRGATEDSSRAVSINDILRNYHGKVVFVDFWASWCGPCRMEMPEAKKLEERYKGKDIVFVYFAVSDTKSAWLTARDEIHILGEHYLLGKRLGLEADTRFGIAGIPHYVLIDKAGNIVDSNAPRPSETEKLVTAIDVQLAK